MYNANPEDFHNRHVTGDETWHHHWDPDTKRVYAMELPWLIPIKEFLHTTISRQGYGHTFGGNRIDKPAGNSITREYYVQCH